MKYIIDKKKKTETIYSMSIACEICMNDDGELAPKSLCADCPDYHKGCHNYKEIYSGKIGMSFLEFMSNDFQKIADELSALFHQVKDKNHDEMLSVLNEHLEPLPYYIKLLGLQETFAYCMEMADKIPDFSSEKMIRNEFEELILIQKIVSAYADDKYFVEPSLLLKAINQYQIMFCPSEYVPDYGDDCSSFRENPIEAIKDFVAECNEKRKNVSEFAVFRHMFGVAFDWIVNNNYKISRCENCGKFFVPYGRYDTRYCPYPLKNGKSCRELSFAINLDNDKVLKEYRKIYKTKHAWMNRNKEIHPSAENDFAKWHKAAKAIVDKYKLGAVSEMECLKWLSDNK